MLTCREVTKLISESLDRPLSFRQRISVAMHLAFCRFCSRYQEQMRLIRAAMRRLATHKGDAVDKTSDASLSPDARERIKRELDRNSR